MHDHYLAYRSFDLVLSLLFVSVLCSHNSDCVRLDMKESIDLEHISVVGDVARHQHGQHEAPKVTGQNSEEIPPGYWRSPRFIGSCLAIIFQANSLFFGYAVPVRFLLCCILQLSEAISHSIYKGQPSCCDKRRHRLVLSISPFCIRT
jgi:hypothetical protein